MFRKPILLLSSGKESIYTSGPLRDSHSQNTESISVSAFTPEDGSTAASEMSCFIKNYTMDKVKKKNHVSESRTFVRGH